MSGSRDARAELFGIAMDVLAEKPIKERKAMATRAAGLAFQAVTSESAASELKRLVGERGSAALLATAARQGRSTGTTKPWSTSSRPRIAISTAEETLNEAIELRAELVVLRADVWLYDKIPIGRRPIDEAERAMTTYDYVVLLASSQAADSEWVQFEMALVTQADLNDRHDRLLPVLVGMQTSDLRPYLRLPRNIKWEDHGSKGVAAIIWHRIEDDRQRSRQDE